jgi:uncharacterized protein (TIGR02391 family)
MAGRPRNNDPPIQRRPTTLTISVAEAREKISTRIQAGKDLAGKQLADVELKAAADAWNRYNLDLLRRMFTDDHIAREVDRAIYSGMLTLDFAGGRGEDVGGRVRTRIAALESVFERLELMADPEIEDAVGAVDPKSRALRAYHDLDLHPEIARAADELYHNGHYANAIDDSVKALNDLVRMRSGESADGTSLMERVFSPSNPILRFNALTDQSDKDEQKGFMMMFSGAVAGLRNPRAHKLIKDDPERALEFIAFVSLLAKLLDGARKRP